MIHLNKLFFVTQCKSTITAQLEFQEEYEQYTLDKETVLLGSSTPLYGAVQLVGNLTLRLLERFDCGAFLCQVGFFENHDSN